MPNQAAEDKSKAETPKEKTFSEAEMRAAVAEASAKALAESNRMLQEAALVRNVTPPPAPAMRRGPDGFDAWSSDGLTRKPEEQANMLRAGARSAARGEITQAVEEIRKEADWKLQAAKDEMALRAILAANPDVASDEEGFAGSLAKAGFRAQQKGVRLDNATLAQQALSIYKEEHKSAEQPAPVLEGASQGGSVGGGSGKKEEGPNPIAQFLLRYYGVGGPNDQVHGEERDFSSEDAVDDYLDGRLSPDTSSAIPVWGITQPLKDGLEGTGLGSGVRQAQGDFNRRKARRAAAGG